MRVLIVDDHPLLRLAIRHTLSVAGGFSVVGEARTPIDAFALVKQEMPEIVLMDIGLPGMDGIQATREIVGQPQPSGHPRGPIPKIVIVSVHDQTRNLLAALNAGAMGYIVKSEGADALVRALRAVARGERYLSAEAAARVALYERRHGGTTDVLAVLSGREREVFRLAADCRLSREIAQELVISRKTVDTHLYRIHRKLGLQTSAELVRLASSLEGFGE